MKIFIEFRKSILANTISAHRRVPEIISKYILTKKVFSNLYIYIYICMCNAR